MSYTEQQRAKNRETVEHLMTENSSQQKNDVIRQLDASWANDEEASKIIEQQKAFFDAEAAPSDEAFKNVRV